MSALEKTSFLRKLKHNGESELRYWLSDLSLNEHLGKSIKLEFTGKIECVQCGRSVKSTFGDGYCFPCSKKLAACDICILKPELCHIRFGTCREPEWAKEHCLIPHIIYLSNTTGLKVGITRAHKKLERWGDQGAVAAVVFAVVPERYISGLMENAIRANISDRADWRALICGKQNQIDLLQEKSKLKNTISDEYKQYVVDGGEYDHVYQFKYPVSKYPAKAVSHNLDKEKILQGEFNGIRGQYIFVGERAINIRKYSGYQVAVTVF